MSCMLTSGVHVKCAGTPFKEDEFIKKKVIEIINNYKFIWDEKNNFNRIMWLDIIRFTNI